MLTVMTPGDQASPASLVLEAEGTKYPSTDMSVVRCCFEISERETIRVFSKEVNGFSEGGWLISRTRACLTSPLTLTNENRRPNRNHGPVITIRETTLCWKHMLHCFAFRQNPTIHFIEMGNCSISKEKTKIALDRQNDNGVTCRSRFAILGACQGARDSVTVLTPREREVLVSPFQSAAWATRQKWFAFELSKTACLHGIVLIRYIVEEPKCSVPKNLMSRN